MKDMDRQTGLLQHSLWHAAMQHRSDYHHGKVAVNSMARSITGLSR
jgi:hypothetical protein